MVVGGKFLTSSCFLRSVFYRECWPPGLPFLPPSSGHNQGPLSEPFWSDVLLGTLRGRVSIRAGGKFPPSLRLVRLNFTGSAGLWVMHSRLFIRFATRDVSLPFGDQTSSLRPSGVLYRLGCGSNFLPSLCYWVRHTFTGSAGLRVWHSCLPFMCTTRV